ncbi:MAG: lytic murein transglycosylase [Caulobacteraceae bacterium]
MNRRHLLALTAAGALAARVAAAPTAAPAAALGASGETWFTGWLNDFYRRTVAAGWPRAVLDREFAGLAADPRVAALDARQPEFARPVSDYVKASVTAGRIAVGQGKRESVPAFPQIERTWGVPREILIAIWAMESGFGALQGTMDVVRSLATLAALGRRRPWAEAELLAALRIVSTREAPRARLIGSWAGAMGQTQLLPSTYLATAVDLTGDGKPDIWGSAPDALASAANLLAKAGWRRGEGWAREVLLPPVFDLGLSEGPALVPDQWRTKGVRLAGGRPWNGQESGAPCVLLLPSGADGPAFLALPNHFVIRKYNNSVSYALAVGLLADRFAGAGPLRTPWPREVPLSLTDRLDAQSALARLGLDPGPPDGVVGLGTRQALRGWQRLQGMPADGYLSPDVVRRLRAAAAARH